MSFCKKSKLFVKILIQTGLLNVEVQTNNQSLSLAPSAPASLAIIAKGLFDFAG